MASTNGRASAGMNRTIPALPVRDMAVAVAHYRDRFGFNAPNVAADFAVLVRDNAVLHLWAASDEEWRVREDLTVLPVCSGAESFLAGTASCRIEVEDVDALFAELQPRGVLHDASKGGVREPTSAPASSRLSTSTATCSRSSAGNDARNSTSTRLDRPGRSCPTDCWEEVAAPGKTGRLQAVRGSETDGSIRKCKEVTFLPLTS